MYLDLELRLGQIHAYEVEGRPEVGRIVRKAGPLAWVLKRGCGAVDQVGWLALAEPTDQQRAEFLGLERGGWEK